LGRISLTVAQKWGRIAFAIGTGREPYPAGIQVGSVEDQVSMRNRFFLLAAVALFLAALLLSCTMGGGRLAEVTPTPTKTPRLLFTSTMTATATPLPSDTPLPTDTPVPPTETPAPTDTALPPTETVIEATATPLPPTDTALPATNTSAPPTNTPRPRATNTPIPPTNTPKPKVDFRIKELYAFEDGSLTSSGLHNVYFTVVDAGGAPIDGVIIEEVNNQDREQVISGDKGPGKAQFLMWASDYRFKVVGNVGGQGLSSETTHVLSIVFEHATWDDLIQGGICSDEASCRAMGPMHFSYNVTFQRTW
jgi:hypothetical protein